MALEGIHKFNEEDKEPNESQGGFQRAGAVMLQMWDSDPLSQAGAHTLHCTEHSATPSEICPWPSEAFV